MGTVTNFADIFRNSFLKQAGTQLTASDVVITFAVTFVAALFIFYIYKRTYQGILYTRSFNVSLVVLALVTALVIMAISSNVVLSLGMVGALSIVRFRTAIKDPMDIVFMFWAIAVGILCGAGLYLLALAGTLFLGIILVVFARIKGTDKPYLLIATLTDSNAEQRVFSILKAGARAHQLKSKTVSPGTTEITVEIRARGNESDLVSQVGGVDGVASAVLVSYNGDYST